MYVFVCVCVYDLRDNTSAKLMMLTQLFARIVDRRQFAQVCVCVCVLMV